MTHATDDFDDDDEDMKIMVPSPEELAIIMDALKTGNVVFLNEEEMIADGMTREHVIELLAAFQKKSTN